MAWLLTDEISFEAIKELASQSDRSAAIVGVAVVEKQLATTIKYRLPGEGETVKELFRAPGGKLADYDAKIKLAYAMGILSKMAFVDLVKMGSIRNKFAHNLDIASFEHPEVAKLCRELELIDKHIFTLGKNVETGPDLQSVSYVADWEEKRDNPRDRFYYTVMFLSNELVVRTPHKSHLPRAH